MASLAAVVRALLRRESQRATGYALREWTMLTARHLPYLQGQLTLGRIAAVGHLQRSTLGRSEWHTSSAPLFGEGRGRWHWGLSTSDVVDGSDHEHHSTETGGRELPSFKTGELGSDVDGDRAALEAWLAQIRDETSGWPELSLDALRDELDEELEGDDDDNDDDDDETYENEELLKALQEAVNRHRTPVVALVSGRVVHLRRTAAPKRSPRAGRAPRNEPKTTSRDTTKADANDNECT